jgi:hypothetical protein
MGLTGSPTGANSGAVPVRSRKGVGLVSAATSPTCCGITTLLLERLPQQFY